MRFDGWLFMILSWMAILGIFIFSLVRVLRQKKQT